MVESVQGEGGVHPATMEFMQGLRKFCDENDMLLLIDEVQTGWCRTGAVMSYMNYGIKPDIVSMAKALGGGMPIGAICATAEVAKAFTAGSHGTTFGGHPVSCAAALAEVNELLDRDLAGNAKKVGDYFAAKLEKLPHVKEVRHQGLLVGVEFDDTIGGVDVKHGCLDRHLLITAIGAHIIRMIPPLIVTEEECDKAVAIIEDTIKSLEKIKIRQRSDTVRTRASRIIFVRPFMISESDKNLSVRGKSMKHLVIRLAANMEPRAMPSVRRLHRIWGLSFMIVILWMRLSKR